MRKTKETDAQNKERAIAALEAAKDREKKKKLVPLHIHDKNNTVLMISPKLNHKQHQKLKAEKQQQLNKRNSIIENKLK